MDLLLAAYHTVHDYRGGASTLGTLLGKAGGTLSHEVCPPEGSKAKLGLLDAAKIVEISRDQRIAHAFAARCGGMFVPLAGLDVDAPDMAQIAEVAREFADVMAEAAKGLADGTVTDNELGRIEREWGELVQRGGQMLAHFRALNAAGKPAPAKGAVHLVSEAVA